MPIHYAQLWQLSPAELFNNAVVIKYRAVHFLFTLVKHLEYYTNKKINPALLTHQPTLTHTHHTHTQTHFLNSSDNDWRDLIPCWSVFPSDMLVCNLTTILTRSWDDYFPFFFFWCEYSPNKFRHVYAQLLTWAKWKLKVQHYPSKSISESS